MSILFNQICLNKEILPKYTYFKLHDPIAYQYNSTLEYKHDFLRRQITLCKDNINKLNHKQWTLNSYKVVMYVERLCCFCNTHTPDKAKRTREPINYGRFINQFRLDIITLLQQLEMIMLWGHILPYPKDGFVNLDIFSELGRSGRQLLVSYETFDRQTVSRERLVLLLYDFLFLLIQ